MESIKKSFISKVNEFIQVVVKTDVKVCTVGDDTVVFKNLGCGFLGCDFNVVTSEYDKIAEAYYRVLNGVYENIEDVIDSDKNIDDEAVGLFYMLAVSSSYETSDERDEIAIHFLDVTYAKYVIESYYLEWANINIELTAEKYNEALSIIKNRFLEADK